MTDYKRSIVVEIDGTGAVVGARKVQASLNDIDRATKNVDGGMRRVGDASRSATSSMYGLGTAAKAAMAYFSVSTMANFAKSVLDAGVAMDSMERSFVAITGNSTAASAEMFFLRDEADRLGQSFYDLAPQFKQIAASARDTALEGEQTRKIFSAITEASTALGLSSDETSGALNALSQMISKGTVQAEELRGQLGERLPGAFQIAARAMGVSTQELGKMLEQGQVLATDLLPKLAEELHKTYGAAAETAGMESARAAVNRMSQEWTDLKNNMFHSETAVAGINMITQAVAGLNAMISQVQQGKAQYIWEGLQMEAMDPSKYRGKVNRDMVMPAYVAPAAANPATGASSSSAAKDLKERERAYKKMLEDGQKAEAAIDAWGKAYDERRVKAIADTVDAHQQAAQKEKAVVEELTGWNQYAAKALEDFAALSARRKGEKESPLLRVEIVDMGGHEHHLRR